MYILFLFFALFLIVIASVCIGALIVIMAIKFGGDANKLRGIVDSLQGQVEQNHDGLYRVREDLDKIKGRFIEKDRRLGNEKDEKF